MSTLAAAIGPSTQQAATKVVVAGLVGAAIDAIYFSSLAWLDGKSPGRTLQGIASFWLGPQSTQLGAESMLLGAGTHVTLALLMAAGFAIYLWCFPALRNSVVQAGVTYGALLYSLMYLVVLPMRWPAIFPRWDGWRSIGDICVHIAISLSFALVFTAMLRSADFAD